MATFVEIVPDAFAVTFAKTANDAKKQPRPGGPGARVTGDHRFDHVRRPVRGIEIKDDTYATIQVITADGRNLPLIDAAGNVKSTSDGQGQSAGYTYQYSNFLIQQTQEQRIEKNQIVVTFGEPYIFFYGEQPRMLNVQGVLLNTLDFNWKAEFLENYDKYLRGTRCVQNKARVYLSWDDIIVEGYIMNCTVDEQSLERNWVTFNFQMFLTNYQNISAIGDPEAHIRGKAINLNPEDIDTLGAASAGFQSSALLVRQQNIAAQASNKGLLSMLRDGQVISAFESGTSRLVEIQGQITDIIDRAADFVSGRNITVPTGFTGAAAFDQDIQLDLASLDSNSFNGNQVTVTGTIGGKQFAIRAQLGNATTPSTYGPLSLNRDEFIARGSPQPSAPEFVDLFKAQRGDDLVAASVVRQTFKTFGIDTEPPNEVMQLIGKVGFGIVSFVAGKQLQSIQSQGARQALNVIPQVVLG
jgi:hypothetical protein